MATSGSASEIPLTGAGNKGVILSGTAVDRVYIRLNAVTGATVNPSANVGAFVMNKGQMTLDLSALDGRLRALERVLGIGAGSSNVSTITVNTGNTVLSYTDLSGVVSDLASFIVTLFDNDAAFDARLANASITVNCVSNTIVGAVHI